VQLRCQRLIALRGVSLQHVEQAQVHAVELNFFHWQSLFEINR
jgi:hypothetical protein